MTSTPPRRCAARLCIAALALAGAPHVGRSQRPSQQLDTGVARIDSGGAARRGVMRCFGISVDRGCRMVVQYEAGYRAPMAGRAPRLVGARARGRSDRSQLFVAGGVLIPVSGRDAVGAIYDAGTGDEEGTRALGVRLAHGLPHETRIDVTAGAAWLPLTGDTVVVSRSVRARGAFVEVALHGSNLLTLVVRDEAYASRRNAEGGNLVFAGARAEAVPAAVLTIIGAAVIGIAVGATGPT